MILIIREAFPHEIDYGLNLLCEAAIWLRDNAIDYWQGWLDPPDEYKAWVKQGFDNGEFHFVECENSKIVGMFRLQFEDEIFWGKRDDKAGYIHSFTTDRNLKGNQIGYSVLHMIEQSLLEKNIRVIRLDCPPTLERLCTYYEDLGFTPKGMVTVFDEELQLYEKKLLIKATNKNVQINGKYDEQLHDGTKPLV